MSCTKDRAQSKPLHAAAFRLSMLDPGKVRHHSSALSSPGNSSRHEVRLQPQEIPGHLSISKRAMVRPRFDLELLKSASLICRKHGAFCIALREHS